MKLIKFCGKNRRESIKKAISFFYDNYDENIFLEELLAKCRIQNDKKTVYFYPNLKIDLKEFRKLKKEKKKQ